MGTDTESDSRRVVCAELLLAMLLIRSPRTIEFLAVAGFAHDEIFVAAQDLFLSGRAEVSIANGLVSLVNCWQK